MFFFLNVAQNIHILVHLYILYIYAFNFLTHVILFHVMSCHVMSCHVMQQGVPMSSEEGLRALYEPGQPAKVKIIACDLPDHKHAGARLLLSFNMSEVSKKHATTYP